MKNILAGTSISEIDAYMNREFGRGSDHSDFLPLVSLRNYAHQTRNFAPAAANTSKGNFHTSDFDPLDPDPTLSIAA